jgi:hypothetical protein
MWEIWQRRWLHQRGHSLVWWIRRYEGKGNQDWLKFPAQAAIPYVLETRNTGGHADIVISLYDSDGAMLLASNDDVPGDQPASWLRWQPDHNGTFCLKVEHWDPCASGCTTEYAVRVRPTLRSVGDWQQSAEGGFDNGQTENILSDQVQWPPLHWSTPLRYRCLTTANQQSLDSDHYEWFRQCL